jgi:hypothetical protein
MRIEKNIIEKVANGETFMKGEPVENAKTILKPGIWSSFKRYAFLYDGDDDNLNDIQDCILDFPIHAAEITVMDIPKEVHPSERLKISGMLPKYSLKNLFGELTDDDEKRDLCEDKTFKIRGVKGKFKVSYTALQYCFGDELISVNECLNMMRI